MTQNIYISKVSVIITVYNGEKYIREALQSVADQGYPNLEILVTDDGSTDNTANIIKEFPATVHYEYQQQQGIAQGWNHGVQKANGKYITFIDADDTWSKGKLNKQVEFLEKNPETDIIFGFAKEFLSPEIPGNHTEKKPIPGFHAGTMMIRRNRFLEIGLFNTKWKKGIFVEWYLRASEAGINVYMDKKIYLYRRIHDSNHGIKERNSYVDYVRMLKASIDRRRSV